MFDPPTSSPLSYIGVLALLFGIFLILAGLDVIRIKQVTVVRGQRTCVLGVIFSVAGLLILMPDIRDHFPTRERTLGEAYPAAAAPSAEIAIPPTSSTDVPVSSEQSESDETPAGADKTATRHALCTGWAKMWRELHSHGVDRLHTDRIRGSMGPDDSSGLYRSRYNQPRFRAGLVPWQYRF